MTTSTSHKQIEFDATGKKLGRFATELAKLLMGKDLPDYQPNTFPQRRIVIMNASKMNIPTKKQKGTIYTRYSGYPGGLKEATMEQVIAKKGYAEVLQRAVYGMLPGNKLRPQMMKQLSITE